MYLEKINSPKDIKNFTAKQREELAAEMRGAMQWGLITGS